MCASLSISNVLDLLTEIIIFLGWSSWVSAQGINVGVSKTRSVHNLEAKILQHVDPSTLPPMCIRYSCQPLEWLVISAQNKVVLIQVLPKVHDAPYECIALSFHRMELLLCLRQTLAGIGYHLLQLPFPLGQNGSDPLGRPINIQAERPLEIRSYKDGRLDQRHS